MPSMSFRANVVIIVVDGGDRVMAFERNDIRGQWQLPQGGIKEGETPVEAAWRELGEETGLDESDVELIAEYPEWTVYEWPSGVRKNGRMGQVQRWFTFRIRSIDIAPEPDGVEFVDWRWVEPTWLIDQVVEFRRPSYRRVLLDA